MHLRSLSIKYCRRIGDKGIITISTLPLKELDISGLLLISGRGIKRIFSMQSLRHLTMKKVHSLQDAHLRNITNLVNLKRLNVSGCNNLSYLSMWHIMNLKSLKSLNLSRNSRFGHKLTWKSLGSLSNLESLSIKGIVISKALSRGLASVIHSWKSLKKLELGFCKIEEMLLGSIRNCPTLKYLCLQGVHNLKARNFKSFERLEYFDFSRSSMPPKGLRYLKSVNTLILNHCRFINETYPITEAFDERLIEKRVFADLKKLKNLTNLSLCSPNLIEKDIRCLSRCKSLESLDLIWFSPSSLNSLIRIGNLNCLTHLNLTNCKILTDETLEEILLRLSKLKSLSLARCVNITDYGITAVSEHCSLLMHLVLFGLDQITTTGMMWLEQLSALEFLEISQCKKVDANVTCSYLKAKNASLYINCDPPQQKASGNESACVIS